MTSRLRDAPSTISHRHRGSKALGEKKIANTGGDFQKKSRKGQKREERLLPPVQAESKGGEILMVLGEGGACTGRFGRGLSRPETGRNRPGRKSPSRAKEKGRESSRVTSGGCRKELVVYPRHRRAADDEKKKKKIRARARLCDQRFPRKGGGNAGECPPR